MDQPVPARCRVANNDGWRCWSSSWRRRSASRSAARRPHSRGRTPDGGPNPIDVHVGGRIRLRRTLLGMSQEQLGEALGLSFQQVQKYERGGNRVSGSRLFDMARVLDVPVGFFFDDMPDCVAAASPSGLHSGAAAPDVQNAEFCHLELDLMRAFRRIKGNDVRSSILRMVNACANAGEV